MPRTAILEAPSSAGGPPPEQDVPLPVPAKTRLYVEQMQASVCKCAHTSSHITASSCLEHLYVWAARCIW